MSQGKLQWRARRGVRELDLVLQRAFHVGFHMTDEEAVMMTRLLDYSDPELTVWLLEKQCPPTEIKPLVERILSYQA